MLFLFFIYLQDTKLLSTFMTMTKFEYITSWQNFNCAVIKYFLWTIYVNIFLSTTHWCHLNWNDGDEEEEKMLTSIKTVFLIIPERVVIFAVIIFSFKGSKASQILIIASVVLLHVKLTNRVFSPIEVTLSWKTTPKSVP
jgi:fatty acid desaturase